MAIRQRTHGGSGNCVEQPLTGPGFADNAIHQLFLAGAHQLGFDEWVFLYKGIEQWLRGIDRHRSVPDQLAFFFCGLDDRGL